MHCTKCDRRCVWLVGSDTDRSLVWCLQKRVRVLRKGSRACRHLHQLACKWPLCPPLPSAPLCTPPRPPSPPTRTHPPTYPQDQKSDSAGGDANFEALAKYGTDLTANAARLDPVIGRDEEIRRVVRILSRCVHLRAEGLDVE
jgi:hypothetical protein